MPRKGPAQVRPIAPDQVYHSVLVSQLTNKVLRNGKKALAERTVYGALDQIAAKVNGDPVAVLERAISNVRPMTEVRSRRVGGATYQVPVVVRDRRSYSLAIRWVVNSARARREKTMAERLANELLDASNGLGTSVKRRDDTHKMAESNRAFMHYRW
ncbi:ribosomal protein S7 [Acidimicrobium ferrooxidans DSM 10331]|uniref:Small ribosomal subunit protein uS7 n=1 Tax=Acidimicrobium ferrooxidans (strain DSM 10331 / JCM 15462 / NBRC 103882 / ICP) TaxID=525909 RepID=C7M2W8_ACIFD|nr:30S ribosomal protein S7 [Acidimicrobium ferrooxidans]ACU53362.1 ribosomal protein S7 [Acidimicrobium ferrooxidans DSM 10331]